MPDFSVVTCVSKPDVYSSCLLDSVNAARKSHDIEIIPIINNNNAYSASDALNIGISVSRSNNLIFAHQDVRLLGDWFDTLSSNLHNIPDNWGVLGAAGISLKFNRDDIGRWGGARNERTVAVGTVYHSDESLDYDPYWDGMKELQLVHCADECLFVLNKKADLRFDTKLNGFHFYGIDICLQARASAYGVYCASLPIIHYGQYSGSLTEDDRYWPHLRYLYDKWHMQFPEVLATHVYWGSDRSKDADIANELTSYIPIRLEDNRGLTVDIRSLGIEKIKLSTDRKQRC